MQLFLPPVRKAQKSDVIYTKLAFFGETLVKLQQLDIKSYLSNS